MATSEEPCVICMDPISDPYTVQCGSKTPHIVCNGCELQWRLKSTPTSEGRTITCPMCRVVEKDTSTRSTASLQAELTHVYFELATKNGKSSPPLNHAIRDYIRLLETVAAVPHIQLAGLMGEPPSSVPVVPISRRARTQIEMEARVVRAVTARQAEANQRAMRQAQEAQRQAAARQARREHAAAERRARNPAVWCESGNIALGLCTTSRKTTRQCSVAGCTHRVCFRCDKCTTH